MPGQSTATVGHSRCGIIWVISQPIPKLDDRLPVNEWQGTSGFEFTIHPHEIVTVRLLGKRPCNHLHTKPWICQLVLQPTTHPE
jgi:hypothetical protein